MGTEACTYRNVSIVEFINSDDHSNHKLDVDDFIEEVFEGKDIDEFKDVVVVIENKTHTCFVVVKTAELLASAKPGHWGR